MGQKRKINDDKKRIGADAVSAIDVSTNNAMKIESDDNVQIIQPTLAAQNELLDFTAMPLPNDSNHNISSPQPININLNNNNNNQQTLLFGDDDDMNDDDVIGDDSSSEGGMVEVQKIEIEQEEDQKNEDVKEKEDEVKQDEIEENVMTEQELEAMEAKRRMYAITEINNSKTLDILRSLDQMEESVTNKKLEKSTIEQLNINWKKHRRTQEKKKKGPKDKKRGRGRPRGSGRGKGRGRGRGRGRKPQPPKSRQKNVVNDDSSEDEVDFGGANDGVFAHLNKNQKKKKKKNSKEEADDDDDESTVSLIDVAPKRAEVAIIDDTDSDNDIQMKIDINEELNINTNISNIFDVQSMVESPVLDVDIMENDNNSNMNNDDDDDNDNSNTNNNNNNNNDDIDNNEQTNEMTETDILLAKLEGYSDFLLKN